MTPPPPTITAWAIKAPDDSILMNTMRVDKKTCIFEYCRGAQWIWNESLIKLGFRCVRVQITEVQE